MLCEEEKAQLPMYYITKQLLDVETLYTSMEKLTYALMVSSKKLRPYFHTHKIEVLMNYPLKQVLQKPDTSGCLLNSAIELYQFDIKYKPWIAIKGQVVANFIA